MTQHTASPGARVGVVVPLYQSGSTVARTLESLRAQTETRWRAIVVDDGSTDDGPAIVRDTMRDEPRITMVRQANRGLAGARNRALDELDALPDPPELVHFLDADDWLRPDGLETLVRAIDASGALGACAGYELFDDTPRPVGRWMLPPATGVDLGALRRENRIVVHSQMLRRDAIGPLRFDERRRVVEDYDLWVRLAERGVRWHAAHGVVACYRLRPGSLSKRARDMLAGVVSILEGTHERGARAGEPGCAGGHLVAAVRANALNYATIGAILEPAPGGSLPVAGCAEGLRLMERWHAGARCAGADVGRALYWGTLFGRCEDPAEALAEPERARSLGGAWGGWLGALIGAGFGAGEPAGFVAEALDALADQLVDRERACAAALDAALRVAPQGPIAIVGYGHNGRTLADLARARGLEATVCDDRLEPGSVADGMPVLPVGEAPGVTVVTPERDASLWTRTGCGPGAVRMNDIRRGLASRARALAADAVRANATDTLLGALRPARTERRSA